LANSRLLPSGNVIIGIKNSFSSGDPHVGPHGN
jgi:hypothetical protein